MTGILGGIASSLGFQAVRDQFQQNLFNRISGGQGGIDLQHWQQALQNLPGGGLAPANNAGVIGTGTASAVDAAFKSIDANGDGQLSQGEFAAALDKMLDKARRQPHGATPLDAQLFGQQQASGGVQAPDFLRRVLLGYGANAG